MNINQINKISWNKQAARYQQNADFSFDNVDYGDIRCKTEKDLLLLGDVKGKRILELGCGGANCGIALAKKGAIVTCTDISEEQIKFAKENAKKEEVNINFIVSSMEDLILGEKEFDIVISVCAMMYVENIDKVYKNVSHVLKEKGIFVFSLNDPTFYSIAAKYLWNEPIEQQTYFYSGEEKWKWEDNDDFEFITYRRPISEYINTLSQNGFLLKNFHQLKVNHEQIENDEEMLEALFPRIMVFKAINFSNPSI